MTGGAARVSRWLGRVLLAVAIGGAVGAIATTGGPPSARPPGRTSVQTAPAADVGATESAAAPPATTPSSVDLHDPLAVAGAVAAGMYQSSGVTEGSRVLSNHARRVFDAFIARSGRRSLAAPTAAYVLDPRTAPVVVQVAVVRWWDDSRAPLPDPSPHLVRLTMVLLPGGRWSIDDIQVVS